MATDKNGIQIVKGHLVKRYGAVQYADGPRFKFSKKTWEVCESNDDGVFYQDERGNPTLLPLAIGIEYVVVGTIVDGIWPQYSRIDDGMVRISVGTVGIKYRMLKDVESQNWKAGEIVMIHGKVHKDMLERGVIEVYSGDEDHQHALVVADPTKVGAAANTD